MTGNTDEITSHPLTNTAETMRDVMEKIGGTEHITAPDDFDLTKAHLVATPSHRTVHDLTDKHRNAAEYLKPARRKGTARLDDLQSIIEWANRFKGETSALFAKPDMTAPTLTCIADYHATGPVDQATAAGDPTARHCHHRAIYNFPLSEEWKAWMKVSCGNDGKPLGNNSFRFHDEPVRHKMLDLIGDPYLLGAPIQGRIVAYKSGPALNQLLVKKLIKQHRKQNLNYLARKSEVIDIRALFRMMPHRYPMLLVDRVIEMDGDRRAVGIKNVTINEPFFQGHYPNTPIMPGVLVVEAMAQMSGVLIGQSLDQVGKLPVLLSLDRVKLRKPVTPGDQLFLEAEAVKVRSRIAHMRCRAYVGEELAAEAEVKFMMVDDNQE